MYSRNCPNCQAKLALKECAPIIFRGFSVCRHCNKPFQVKRQAIRINAIISGIIVVMLAKSTLDASLLECIVYSSVFYFGFQRFIDFFYEFEAADEKLANHR